MRNNPWKTGLAMAATLIAILFALTACSSDSADSDAVEQLRATLTSEQAKLESVNQEKVQAEACYAQVSGWTRDMEQLEVPDGCFGAGDAGRIASKMASLARGKETKSDDWRLRCNQPPAGWTRKQSAPTEPKKGCGRTRRRPASSERQLAQAERDTVKFQLESAKTIREGSDTIAEDTVDTIITRSEISRESEAFWKTRFDDLEDKHEELLSRMEALTNAQAQFDARVLEHVEANTKTERERLAAEQEKARREIEAAEKRVTTAEKARENAMVARLHAEKEADKTTVTYTTRLQELSKRESEFDSKKANNDAECGTAWNRIDAEINNILQQTSLLPPAQDETQRTSRVADIQYKMNVIRSLWSEFGNDCRVSR